MFKDSVSTRVQWLLLPAFVLAHFSHHLITALPAPLLPLIRDDFALNYTESGLLVSAFSLAYGFSQLPAGWLADRIGPRWLITIGIAGVGLTGILVGFTQSYLMLAVILVILGIMAGGYHPAAPPLISAIVSPGKRGRALGFHFIGGSASHMAAPLLAAAIAIAWGWRGSFIVLGIPVLIFGIGFSIFLQRISGIINSVGGEEATETQDLPVRQNNRRLVIFIALATLNGAAIFSVASMVPLYIADHFGVARETAVAFAAVFYIAGFWAGPLGGYLADRIGTMPVMLLTCFLAGPAIYLLRWVDFGVGLVSVLLLAGTIMYVRAPVSEFYIVSHSPKKHRSKILGIFYFGGMEGVGVLTPVLGYLFDVFGFNTSFTIIAVFLFLIALAWFFLLGWKDKASHNPIKGGIL